MRSKSFLAEKTEFETSRAREGSDNNVRVYPFGAFQRRPVDSNDNNDNNDDDDNDNDEDEDEDSQSSDGDKQPDRPYRLDASFPSHAFAPNQTLLALSLGMPFKPNTLADAGSQAVALKKKRVYKIVKSSLLIPGDGEPIENGALVIDGKLIAWVGEYKDLPIKYTKDNKHQSYEVPYLMPGMWECHAHFMGESPNEAASYVGVLTNHPASCGARLARGCWQALQYGYTSMRDLGGFGCEVAQAITDGYIVGPNIYSSGALLSQTAGHGDIFPMPAGDVLLNFGISTITPGHFASGIICLVDGIEECRRAVRLQIRRGAKVIKIVASGGVMSLSDNVMYAQFSPSELAVIVEEANRLGRVVAAHVHGKAGIMAAVKAGCKTVEHVSFADEECIELMKQKGTIFVATRMVIEGLMATEGKGLPAESWEKAKLCATHHLESYQLAIKAGLTMALGSDTPPGAPHAFEIELAVQCGMTPLEALKAATANGPLSVGSEMTPLTGQLKAGYEADIVGVKANPLDDVKVLQKMENIGWVWKGGRLFKGPGIGPWGEGAGNLYDELRPKE